MKLLYSFGLLLVSYISFAQQTLMGRIQNENQQYISGATLYNSSTDHITESDKYGNFTLPAKPGDKIRVAFPGFENINYIVQSIDNSQAKTFTLTRLPQDIEEVKIVYQPTGNLEKDVPHFGDSKKLAKLKDDLSIYLTQKPSPEAMKREPGEFVQPVGPGFSIGKVDDRWKDMDFVEFLMRNLPTEYFTEELNLKQQEILPFIFFVLKDFERKKILKYGVVSPQDMAKFKMAALQILPIYKSGKPFEKKKKKKFFIF